MLLTMVLFLMADLAFLAMMLAMPRMRGEDAFFGSRVSRESYQGIGKVIFNRYCFWQVMNFLEIELIGWILLYYRFNVPYVRTMATILLLPSSFLVYLFFSKQVKPLEIVQAQQKFASSLKVRHMRDYTNIFLEIANLLLVIAPILLLIYFYPQLPDRLPIHWNIAGNPDHFAQKSFTTVFAMPVVTLYMQGLLFLCKYGMLETKMTLPAEHTREYLDGKEEALNCTIKMLDWVRMLQAAIFSAISINLVLYMTSARIWLKLINGTIISLTIILLVMALYSVYKLLIIDQRLKALTGRVYVQRDSDAAHWYGGGTIYYNREDPTLFIEKMVGLGYTLNFGNPRVYFYLGYILLLPVLVMWLLHDLR